MTHVIVNNGAIRIFATGDIKGSIPNIDAENGIVMMFDDSVMPKGAAKKF